jgi:uncharacterized protein DUF7005
MTTQREVRASVLARFGADSAVTEELLSYDPDGLGGDRLSDELRFPLDDEPFVDVWREYNRIASTSGFQSLADRLVQLRFPIQEGISSTEDYRAATRRGAPTGDMPSATGLTVVRPESCTITIHPTWAGSIPIIQTGCREDFESLVRAFTARNEPVPVPASQGACVVTGYNNWDRVRRLEDRWTAEHPDRLFSLGEVAYLKDAYQDRFLLLSSGWYSGVTPDRIGVAAEEWQRLSLIIRREHECAHYWTRRTRSSMRNRVFDEVIADSCGILAACGRLRADWLLAFLGIEKNGTVSDGGRLHNYYGSPPISIASRALLRQLVVVAAENLEALGFRHADALHGETGLLLILMTLSGLSLEQLAGPDAQILLTDELQRNRALLASVVTGRQFSRDESRR